MALYKTSILITGGTQGLGYQCSLALAQQCPNTLIVVASRTDPKNSATRINKTLSQSNTKYMSMDLSSLAAVRSFAQSWHAASHPPIQALVLNAGIQFPNAIEHTTDGIEKTFAVNHVGHALLFHLLAPSLTPDARVVITSSGVHDAEQKFMTPRYPNVNEVAYPSKEFAKLNTGRDRYATSKLANVLWMYALARHFSEAAESRGRTVTAMDPGTMPGTNLARGASPVERFLWYQVMPRIIPLLRRIMDPNIHSVEESGGALAWLAAGEGAKGKSGVYYEGRREKASSKQSRDVETQEELWEWTVKFVGRSTEERERFKRIE